MLEEHFCKPTAIRPAEEASATAAKGISLSRYHRLKVLSDDQLEAVHDASIALLGRTGVRFDGEDARRRLVAAGASPHPTREGVVTFPREMVEEGVRKVTRRNVFPARERGKDLVYDGEHMFPYGGGGDPKIIDLDTGIVRPSTFNDVAMAARLGDALENCNYVSSLVMANDAPPGLLVVKTMEAAMANSGKPAAGYAPNAATVDVLFRMWSCVAGGDEELRRRPLFSLGGSPSSPLTYSRSNCEVLLRSVELGIPFSTYPCPICGETGPMTLSGSLALQNAEALAGLMLIQTVTTDLPVVYSGRECVMDPRSGRDLWGAPEVALASATMVQLAHRYGMVADVNGLSSDITRWDLQIGFEQVANALLPALAGADSMSGLGAGWDGASSLEMMVIGDEAFSDIARVLRGIRVDEDSLAVGLTDRVGHMGSFLSERHTLESIRAGELRESPLWDRRNLERAGREGARPTQERAREVVRRILREHTPEPLDRDVKRDVERVVKEAARALA